MPHQESSTISVAKSNGYKRTKVALLWSITRDDPEIPDNPPISFPAFNPDEEKFDFQIVHLEKATAINSLQKFFNEEKYDFYFNICDGFEQFDNAGVEICEYLYRKCPVPFVSPTPEFFLISKFQMKFIASFSGISTPKFCFIFNERDFQKNRKYLLNNMEFPMIVKHHNSGGSEGMSENSVVWEEEDLKTRIFCMVDEYGGALIEEFVRGPEYTVLVQENPADENSPIVHPPYRCVLPDGDDDFKYVARKYFDLGKLMCQKVEDQNLAEQLRSATKQIFLACHANTYARCDYRQCSKTGVIYFLEINAIPCLFVEEVEHGMADIILEKSGARRSFLRTVLECASKSYQKRRANFENLSSNRQPDFGFAKAKKFIKKNDVIIDFTQLPNVKIVNKCEFSRYCPEFYKFFMATSLPINSNLRLWLYNGWQAREDLELVALKRSSSSKNSNCYLDENLRLVATKDIDRNEVFILNESMDF